jgi:hypothetical protein
MEQIQTDYHAWILRIANLVRQKRFEEINPEELAEELENMGVKERREMTNRMMILIAHLLKWQFQADNRSRSWYGSIFEQRKQILRELKLSPSLKPYISTAIFEAYPDAADLAIRETKLPSHFFPETCPYSIEQLLDYDFFPDAI